MADVVTLSPSLKAAGPIEFVDLGAQRRRIGAGMDEAIRRVVDHGRFILGPEVGELERQLAEFCGARHVLSCANGTDALGLALMAKGSDSVRKRPAVTALPSGRQALNISNSAVN